MLDPAVILFKAVYQQTKGSIEAAILELKRKGWTQTETAQVIAEVFEVTTTYAEEIVATSVAWEQ